MRLDEQNVVKQRGYAEAMRCIADARDILQKAPKDGPDFLKYKRDVRKVCGTAYKGMLAALDTYLELKHEPPLNRQQRKNIYYIKDLLFKSDISLGTYVYSAHNILYWSCYCDGMSYIGFIEMGFDRAMKMIKKIKPRGVANPQPGGAK